MKSFLEESIEQWVEAHERLYPGHDTNYTVNSDGITLSNGTKLTHSQLRVATAKMRAQIDKQEGKPVFTQTVERKVARERLIEAIKNGNQGNLVIGEVLHEHYSKNKSVAALEAWLRSIGLKLPSEGSRSKYRRAYETWVLNAGLTMNDTYTHPEYVNDAGQMIPMTLTGVSTYSLYEARNLVTKHNAVEMLAWVFNSTLDEIKDAAHNKNQELEPSEPLRSLPKIPESLMEMFKQLETTAFEGKSRIEVMQFLIQFTHDLYEQDPDTFSATIDAYFGEATQESDG